MVFLHVAALLCTLSHIHGQDIGIYDGRLFGIDDDIHDHHYHDLRSGLGIAHRPFGGPGLLPGVGDIGIGGGVGVVGGGVGVIGGGGIAIAGGASARLRPCQRSTCNRKFIPTQCKYVPIFRDLSGRYCRGCAEDICSGQGRQGLRGGNRRRQRKIQRRICRATGRCFGGVGAGGIGGVGIGGVGVIGGIGGVGGTLGRMGRW